MESSDILQAVIYYFKPIVFHPFILWRTYSIITVCRHIITDNRLTYKLNNRPLLVEKGEAIHLISLLSRANWPSLREICKHFIDVYDFCVLQFVLNNTLFVLKSILKSLYLRVIIVTLSPHSISVTEKLLSILLFRFAYTHFVCLKKLFCNLKTRLKLLFWKRRTASVIERLPFECELERE